MSKSKNDRERDKVVQDRLQILLTKMLQDDDNKYCVDCDSKGPRWASWNLGIFLCIRCAGIHRNLGVHISRVKSVNLDSWTPQQVASMQIMGNSRARAIYEAQVSEEFRRPQTDQQLEIFIRAKYEKKKYIAREWVPTRAPDYPVGWNELIEAEKQKKDLRSVVLPTSSKQSTTPTSAPTTPTIRPITTNPTAPQPKEVKPVDPPSSVISLSSDLFSLTVNEPSNPIQNDPIKAKSNYSSDLLGLGDVTTSNNHHSDLDFLGLASPSTNSQNNLFNNNSAAPHCKSESNLFNLESNLGATTGSQSETTKLSKDSILALFNKPSTGPTFQQMPQSQPQIPNFMTDFGNNQKPQQFNNFGVPQAGPMGSNFGALNNPFLAMSTIPSAHSAPNIDQTRNPTFGGLNGLNFL